MNLVKFEKNSTSIGTFITELVIIACLILLSCAIKNNDTMTSADNIDSTGWEIVKGNMPSPYLTDYNFFANSNWMRISKDEFKDSLDTQNYGIRIYLNSKKDSLMKLIFLPEKTKKQMINDFVFDSSSPYLKNQLNKVFFNFAYEDLEGKIVSKDKLKGKIIVLNYWFIGCKGCLDEMVTLNKLVDKYQENKDIIFLAPTNDSKDKLDKFLKTHQFKYKVVSASYNLDEGVFINSFPTHILVDKLGITRFIYNSGAVNINYVLDNEIEKYL